MRSTPRSSARSAPIETRPARSPRPRPAGAAFPAALACLAFCLAGCGAKKTEARRAAAPKAQPVEVATVQRRDLAETINLVGSVAATESAQVRTELSGLVREIVFQEGQAVKRGQVLLKIDDTEIAAQAEEAAATFRLAELNLQRADNLAKTHNLTEADRDRAEAEFRSAKARLALQRGRLAKTEIRAPFDGVAGARAVSPGDYVTSQSVITVIDDLSRLKIEFEVPERYLGLVQPGTAFTVKPSGAPAVAGEVFFVSPTLGRQTRSGPAKGFLSESPPGLKPGMFANIELVLARHPGVLVVPESAILVSGAGPRIVVARKAATGSTADFVPVRLGLRHKGFVEVEALRGSLAPDTAVVAAGVGAITLFQDAPLEVRPLRKELLLAAEQ